MLKKSFRFIFSMNILIIVFSFNLDNLHAETKDIKIELKKKIEHGVIKSAKSVYEIIEPKSYRYLNEKKNTSHSHAPFTWLYYLLPNAWFDYVVVMDRESRILTDVKIKLKSGEDKIIPYLLLRFVSSIEENKINRFIVGGLPKREHEKRYRIKSELIFFQKSVKLSRYTRNESDDIQVIIGEIRIMYIKKHKQQTDGRYFYREGDDYKLLYDISLFTLEPFISNEK